MQWLMALTPPAAPVRRVMDAVFSLVPLLMGVCSLLLIGYARASLPMERRERAWLYGLPALAALVWRLAYAAGRIGGETGYRAGLLLSAAVCAVCTAAHLLFRRRERLRLPPELCAAGGLLLAAVLVGGAALTISLLG